MRVELRDEAREDAANSSIDRAILELLFPYCSAARRRSVRSPNLLGLSLTKKEADC